MSYNNCCSGNYSFHTLGNSCHDPVTSPDVLCPTEVGCEDALCSLGSNTIHVNCHEPCGEPMCCRSTSCDNSPCSAFGCSLIGSDISRSRQGIGRLPLTSHGSRSCHPASCRQCLSCHLPSYLIYSHQPLSYLWYVFYDYPSLSYMSDYCRPVNYIYSAFQPYSSSLSSWQYPY
uniref:Keratin-associated protein n=1 Tax=Loxodonta africana TaxID=9785 RepID=G3U2S3_LOXAF